MQTTTRIEYAFEQSQNVNTAYAFQPVSFSAPGGSSGAMRYDASGKMTEVTVAGAKGAAGPVTQNRYYQSGPFAGMLEYTTTKANPTDAERKTSYSYTTETLGQSFGTRHTVTDHVTGLVSSSLQDATGNVVSSTDSRGRTVTSTEDGEGRNVMAQDEDGNAVYSHYDVTGQKTAERRHKVSAPGEPEINSWTFFEYDEAGRTVRTWSTAEDRTTVLSESRTVYTSDASGRTEMSIGSDGSGSRSIYDGGGRLSTST